MCAKESRYTSHLKNSTTMKSAKRYNIPSTGGKSGGRLYCKEYGGGGCGEIVVGRVKGFLMRIFDGNDWRREEIIVSGNR